MFGTLFRRSKPAGQGRIPDGRAVYAIGDIHGRLDLLNDLLRRIERDAAGLPAGTAYAIWTGIGSVGVTLLGILVFGESMQPARLACIGLVIAGTVGLNFFNAA